MTVGIAPGPIALHGGGEFLPGDEAFLRALLAAARPSAGSGAPDRGPRAGPIRVVILPTAAARQRPEQAADHGRRAFIEAATTGPRAGVAAEVEVEVAMIVDRASAEDPAEAERLAGADLVYLPGGDPNLIPLVLPGTLALRSMLAALARGAVLAGASAGAMALAPWTWTPDGGRAGLGLVPGIVVFPHFDGDADRARRHLATGRPPAGLGLLGLAERTGVVSTPGPDGGRGPEWRVHGPGLVRWYPPGALDPVVAGDGGTLVLPG